MENGLSNEKQSPVGDTQRMFTTDSEIGLAARCFRKTRLTQVMILLALPIALIAWALAANLFDLDPIFASRAAMLTCAPFVIAAIFSPLLRRYPKEVRWRAYVVQWFILAVVLNILWQMPPLVFRFVFEPLYGGGVDPTQVTMTYQIFWWGYHSSDLDYGYLTRFWILAEVSFWVISALVIVALVKLWRGREKQAFTLLGVCGALQLYNVLFFLGYGGIVGLESSGKIFDNIATDSVLAPILYWLFNLLWGIAGVIASVLSFKCLFYINKKAESGAT